MKPLYLLTFFFFSNCLWSKSLKKEVSKLLKERSFYSRTNAKNLFNGLAVAKSDVSTYELGGVKKQRMVTTVGGLHSRKCEEPLRVYSNFESYDTYFDFISDSKYTNDIANMRLKITIFNVLITLKMKKVTSPGVYNFMLDVGDIKDTKGTFEVFEKDGRCLFLSKMVYDGAHSGYWDSVLEALFVKVSTLGVSKIFRLSGHKILE